MYVYDVFHLFLSLFNFQFSFRIGICEWSVWDHASPFSLSPFLPLPHPVSWRIKLMIVPVLNYSWFNKIDAYLFRFVASQNFLSLPNHYSIYIYIFIIIFFKIVDFTASVWLAYLSTCEEVPTALNHPAWNVSRGISHPPGQSSHSTEYSHFLFTHLIKTLWLYSNRYTVSENILHGK